MKRESLNKKDKHKVNRKIKRNDIDEDMEMPVAKKENEASNKQSV